MGREDLFPGERSSTGWGRKDSGFPRGTDGTYLLEGLRPGRYRVSVRGENFPERFQEAHVTPGSTVNLDFVLSP